MMLLLAALLAHPDPNLVAAFCQTQPVYATSGRINQGTGAAANTYQAFPSIGPSVTLGTSCGPKNHWYVTTILAISLTVYGSASQTYECISSPSAFTTVDGLSEPPIPPLCNNAPTNTPTGQIAGSPVIGGIASANITQGASQVMTGHVQMPNNSTFTANCWIAAPNTNNNTVTGFCFVEADPI